jgi:site-specific recombinase XerD
MKLVQGVTQYIDYKQSIGMAFENEAKILRFFCRRIGDMEIENVGADQVREFLDGSRPITFYWNRKYEALLGFYRYAMLRNYAAASPLPKSLPRTVQRFRPHIYTTDEINRLLRATDTPQPNWSKISPRTMRALLPTLYGAGLRISEALKLTTADADLRTDVLTIRESKFYKSRLIPIGRDLSGVLNDYAAQRQRSSHTAETTTPFFCTRKGRPINLGNARSAFARLRNQAGVARNDDARYQPRLHDLRHTVAVHRLLAWYRAGEDVQRLLPHLSTYLGHISVAATQGYLTMTPELLCQAGKRFERYAYPEAANG